MCLQKSKSNWEQIYDEWNRDSFLKRKHILENGHWLDSMKRRKVTRKLQASSAITYFRGYLQNHFAWLWISRAFLTHDIVFCLVCVCGPNGDEFPVFLQLPSFTFEFLCLFLQLCPMTTTLFSTLWVLCKYHEILNLKKKINLFKFSWWTFTVLSEENESINKRITSLVLLKLLNRVGGFAVEAENVKWRSLRRDWFNFSQRKEK